MQNAILIVEDDTDLRLLYKLFLTSQGYSVQAAASGEEAWKLLNENEVKVILLDLTLPTMSGEEFIARLRRDHRHAHRKVIVTSGWDDLKFKARDLGADDYLVKPTPMDQLKAKIDSLSSQ